MKGIHYALQLQVGKSYTKLCLLGHGSDKKEEHPDASKELELLACLNIQLLSFKVQSQPEYQLHMLQCDATTQFLL